LICWQLRGGENVHGHVGAMDRYTTGTDTRQMGGTCCLRIHKLLTYSCTCTRRHCVHGCNDHATPTERFARTCHAQLTHKDAHATPSSHTSHAAACAALACRCMQQLTDPHNTTLPHAQCQVMHSYSHAAAHSAAKHIDSHPRSCG
jgi:hypothetical protein